jgi:hemoglobin-like flavoprotein
MTPEQIALVDQTLARMRPRLDGIVRDFYARLFVASPDIAAMFTEDPETQRARFALELDTIATSIRRHDEFLPEVLALGARHYGYGVRAAHYRTAGPILLGALARGLGDGWTADVETAWRLAFNLTAEAMMTGAAESG